MHVYRWDLDKTYLLTDFDSLSGLVRSATEPASAKRAVPGATALMRGLSANAQARIYIVSGSPTQMRPVLEEKLRMDGVRWDHLTLKDNLANLKRGRIRAIRGQLGYKLPVLLETRAGLGRSVQETCFGDDAEVDAIAYCLYADAVAGRMEPRQLSRVLEAAGAYPDQIQRCLGALVKVATAEAVQRVFIRLERRLPPQRFDALGSRVVPIHSWWQAALVLFEAGHLSQSDVVGVLEAVFAEVGREPFAIAGLTQDIVRRGHVSAELLDRLPVELPALAMCRQALAELGPRPPAPPVGGPVDYLALLQSSSRIE